MNNFCFKSKRNIIIAILTFLLFIPNIYINNVTADELISISGSITWQDNSDTIRPNSVVVSLYADGEKIVGQERVISAEDDWKYTFDNLPKNNQDNIAIEYCVKESSFIYNDNGVETTYSVIENDGLISIIKYTINTDDNYNFINNHEIETTNITVIKKWKY